MFQSTENVEGNASAGEELGCQMLSGAMELEAFGVAVKLGFRPGLPSTGMTGHGISKWKGQARYYLTSLCFCICNLCGRPERRLVNS